MAYQLDPFQAYLNQTIQTQPSRKVSEEDLLARGQRLEAFGLGDSALGRVNDFALTGVRARDQMTEALKQSAIQGIMGKSAASGLAGAAGAGGAAGAAGGMGAAGAMAAM